MSPHALYGRPPQGLIDIHEEAVQYSPLVPGSLRLEQSADRSLASAVIYAPPGTLERVHALALAVRALAEDAPLTALALKDKGGSRIAGELRAMGCDVVSHARSHHRIVTTTRPPRLIGLDAAIEAGGPQQHPPGGRWTQPGIFSWNRVDPGSALLLQHLPRQSGRSADWGCGNGVLGAAVLGSPAVTAMTLIDIDRRAVEAAERNVVDRRATFLWGDLRTDLVPRASLDFVVMNPPFHDSGVEDRSLGQMLIERAAAALAPGGQCWLTANRHLPYEGSLAKLFGRVRLVDDAKGYKIFAAEK